MVDTFELSWNLEPRQKEHLVEDLGIALKEFAKVTQGKEPGFTFKAYDIKVASVCIIKVVVNVPKVLGRGYIVEEDYETLKSLISSQLQMYFGDQRMFKNHTLKRFDYRLDCQGISPEHRRVYIKLFDKAKDKYNRMVKQGVLGPHGSVKSKYSTGNIYGNQSVTVAVYDKESECLSKQAPVESWEKGVLRFEVRLKANHLKNKKRVGREDKLKDYWSVERQKEYIRSHLLPIYYRGPYYTHERAKELIYASSKSEKKKSVLDEFLRLLGKGSFNTPLKKMSKSTVRSRLKDLEELEINPYTIPIKDATSFSSLPNIIEQKLKTL
ncbi:hypothetical protein [Psychrobacillus psychrotolerans]|uniref:hypothetical protein n=1 Tax=Psychrobacillus psychrotolerans TaxID=126156 RepID=UPI003B02CD6C